MLCWFKDFMQLNVFIKTFRLLVFKTYVRMITFDKCNSVRTIINSTFWNYFYLLVTADIGLNILNMVKPVHIQHFRMNNFVTFDFKPFFIQHGSHAACAQTKQLLQRKEIWYNSNILYDTRYSYWHFDTRTYYITFGESCYTERKMLIMFAWNNILPFHSDTLFLYFNKLNSINISTILL